MWKRRSVPIEKQRARIPGGLRIYAVGDVHGCANLLDEVLSAIDADLAKYPVIRPIEIFLGDYVDRGPSSRTVIDLLIARSRTHETRCLKGNHEILFLDFLKKPVILAQWRSLGGLETLMSYGLSSSHVGDPAVQTKLATDLKRVLPDSHHKFLTNLLPSFACGDYFFAHAGVRPGVPLAQQHERDLLWIREEFLSYQGEFGKVIVHGHTPVSEPEIKPNRINIDTGAYATGRLTCLVLEGDELCFI